MPKPLYETKNILADEPYLSKVEFLPIPNIVADFQLNANTDLLLKAIRTMWREVVGLLRLEGLHKTYRASSAAKPADGKITVVGPNRLVDGETFVLSDGASTVTFEFDVAGNGVGGGNAQIDVSSATSIDDVRDAVVAAINSSGLNITAQPTHTLPSYVGGGGTGPGVDLFNTTTTHADLAAQAAQNTTITDTVADEGFTHQGMRGARINKAVGEIYTIGPDDIEDGETFVIPAQDGNPQETYEFDKDASVAGGNFAVALGEASTAEHVASALANIITINAADVVAAVAHVPATGHLTALAPSKLIDGETFTLDDGVNTPVVFEFDKTGDGVEAGNTSIDISSATTMQDVRAAMIAAINGAGLGITAFNRGFGERITLTNSLSGSATNTGAITHTVAHQDFLTGPMAGYRARVQLQNSTAGTAYNQALSDTVADEDFVVVGMQGGADAGWDISGGRCVLEGFDITFEAVARLAAVVGKQNFLVVRVTETRLTQETDPGEVAITIPGIVGTQYGGNLYRWAATLTIEGFDATPPTLAENESLIVEGYLCEFDDTNGQTIVANTEIPIRVSKFGVFLEPQDVTTKVSKTGDTMSGQLDITVDSGNDDGLLATGGPIDGSGAVLTGRGSGCGVEGISSASEGEAGVKGTGGTAGVKGSTAKTNGIGAQGTATGTNGVGLKGTGSIGAQIEKTSATHPHIRVVAHGDSATPPTDTQKGDLWVPTSGPGGGQLYIHDGTAYATVRAPTLGKVGNVQDIASSDKDMLRYKGSNSQWERVSAVLQEKMYLSPKDAVITVSNATLGNFTAELSRGEISITATGTSAGATMEVVWVLPVPPGWESWGSGVGSVLVVPVNPSQTTITQEIEVYDAEHSLDHNPGASAIGSTGWQDLLVNDSDLSSNYINPSNNQGNMIVRASFAFGNTETIAVGGLYVKSRQQSPFGSLPYGA